MADNIGNLAVQLSLDAVAFSQGLDASAAKFKQFEAEGRRVALDVQTPDEKYATEIGPATTVARRRGHQSDDVCPGDGASENGT